jgi:hypothetical protein
MVQDKSHQWVREFRHRVGWGLQATALPDDPDPARRVMAAGASPRRSGLTRSSSVTILRTRLKSGCIWARSRSRPRGFALVQSSSAQATGHRS